MPVGDALAGDLSAAAREQRARRRSRGCGCGGELWGGLPSRRRLSRRRLSRGRLSHRRAVTALVAEDDHISEGRDLARPSHGETAIQAAGKACADAELARAQRRLEREARGRDGLRAHPGLSCTRGPRTCPSGLVRHPDGGQRPVSQTQQDEAALRRQIEDVDLPRC